MNFFKPYVALKTDSQGRYIDRMQFDNLNEAQMSVGGDYKWIILPAGCAEDLVARQTIPLNRSGPYQTTDW
jgi:hypothetical protein